MNQSPSRWLYLLLLIPMLVQTARAEEEAEGSNINPPRLMAVTVPGLQQSPDHFDIPLQLGPGNGLALAISGRWTFYGGTILSQRPRIIGPLRIDLYGPTNAGRKLMARVLLKYYPLGGNRWQPMYQLDQEPVMIKSGDRWVPLFDSPESPEMLAVLNKTLPNGEGYYPFLDVQLYKGPVTIDSWVVKTGP
jgi:hypothetical protein